MTFLEYLKKEKEIDPQGKDLDALMDEYYEEYLDFMRNKKDGCSDK